MIILNKNDAPYYKRSDGIVSYLLASQSTSNSEFLTTSTVEIMPGGFQKIHHHSPEQVYYIISGNGLMTVGDETERVTPGDCIFIPSGCNHGLKNDGEITLKYFSAAAPSFETDDLKSLWPVKSKSEKKIS